MFMPVKEDKEITRLDVLARLLKDYDEYVLRNLQRKYTPEELGISKQYASYVLLKNSYNELVREMKEKKVSKE